LHSIIDEEIIKTISDEYGTPCYIYLLDIINDNWNMLKSTLPKDSIVFYSVKANPNPEIIRFIDSLNGAFEIASINELNILINNGVNPNKIIYIAPAKSKQDILSSIKCNIKAIVIDSLNELTMLKDIAKKANKNITIMFRLNSGNRSNSSLSMSGKTQFGLSKNEIIREITKIFKEKSNLSVIGLHSYQGSNIIEADKLICEVKVIINEFIAIIKETGLNPLILDFGGGFSSQFSTTEKELNLSVLQKGITELFNQYAEELGQSKIAFESGRFIVGKSGLLVSRVRDIKNKYIFIDAGIHCYGGFDRSFRFRVPPISVLNNVNSIETYTICGPSCTPLDQLAYNISLPRPSIGDLLVFENVGAYQYTASAGNFLSFGYPNEVCLFRNKKTIKKD
jgi:diaminopimelate decarboxylase